MPAGVDLEALFPDALPEQINRIRHATERMSPATWDSGLMMIGGPILSCSLIGTMPLGEDDEAELELSVGTVDGEQGVLVSATLGVYCWCDQNHNIHYVREARTSTTTAEELTAAIESASEQLVQWRDTASHDAEWWRAQAGLPLKQG